MTVKEIQAARYINEDTIECDIFCKAKTNYNLPYRHMLYQFNSAPLYSELYDKRWWLVPPTGKKYHIYYKYIFNIYV